MSVISPLLKKFPIEALQQNAINKMKSKKSPNARVFSFEDVHFKPGARRFIAAELRDFYLWYRECASELKHFYELILEDYPCRLYFDLEFPYDVNKEANGPALTKEFCAIVCSSLLSLLNIDLNPDKHFLILDSSNDTKFSAHVIVHVKKDGEEERLFPNNLALKTIIMYICSNLLKSNSCILNGFRDIPIFLCDIAVYTRNRNFRIFQSSKCGKDTALKLADYCNFYGENPLPKNAQIFIDSLIIPYGYDKLGLINLGSLPAVCALNTSVEALRRKCSGGINGGIEPFLTVDNNLDLRSNWEEENDQNQPSTSFSVPKVPLKVNNYPSTSGKFYSRIEELAGGQGTSSPFPFLDTFMLGIFRRFNPRADIKMWCIICVYVNESKNENINASVPISKTNGVFSCDRYYSLQYKLNNSRYCMSRGREHRAHQVYWMVNLTNFYFVQRCFDQIDCPKYISPAFAFPREICFRLYSSIGPVFSKLGISTKYYTLPDLDSLLQKRYPAVSDSFNKSIEWSNKFGAAMNFLELHSTPSILKELENSIIQDEEEEIDVVN